MGKKQRHSIWPFWVDCKILYVGVGGIIQEGVLHHFHALSHLDGIGLDWLGLIQVCSPLDGFCIVTKGCSAGEAPISCLPAFYRRPCGRSTSRRSGP